MVVPGSRAPVKRKLAMLACGGTTAYRRVRSRAASLSRLASSQPRSGVDTSPEERQ